MFPLVSFFYNSVNENVFIWFQCSLNVFYFLLYIYYAFYITVQFEDMLNDLMAQAETLVLFANGSDGLLTCALRPSNVFGPGETQFFSFLVERAKSGWAKVRVLYHHFTFVFLCYRLYDLCEIYQMTESLDAAKETIPDWLWTQIPKSSINRNLHTNQGEKQ